MMPPAGAASARAAWPAQAGAELSSTMLASLAVLAAGSAILGLWAQLYTDLPSVVTFATLATVGLLVFRGEYRPLFAAAFGINTAAAVLIAWALAAGGGDFFLPGRDDQLFHDVSTMLAREWWRAPGYAHYSGYGFILMGAGLHTVLAPLGEVGVMPVRLLNGFAAATMAPAVLLIGRQVPALGPTVARTAAWATVLFPTLVLFAAVGLRDIWIAAFGTWILALLASHRPESRTRPHLWVAAGLLTLATAAFRPFSVAPVAGFMLVLLMHGRATLASLLFRGAVLLGIVLAAAVTWSLAANVALLEILKYSGFVTEGAEAGSLGARLIALPTPLSELGRLAYALLLPIPPLARIEPQQVMLGAGAVIWYAALPFFFVGIRAVWRDPPSRPFARAATAMMAIALAGLAFTSLDVRHKIIMFPIGLLFAVHGLRVAGPVGLRRVALLYALAGSAMVLAYLWLKLL